MTTILNLDPSSLPDDGDAPLYNAATKKWLPGPVGGTSSAAAPTDIIVGAPTGANDHTLINAAIAAAMTTGQPSRLIFAPGVYICPSPLTAMTDSSSIEFVGSGGRNPGAGFRVGRRTEIRYTGTGTGRFIDATDASGFTISGLAVTYSSSSFSGTLIYAGGGANAPSYSPKFKDSFLGASTAGVKTATVIDLNMVVECSIHDCVISGFSVGINGGPGSYSNSVTMIGGRFSECSVAAVYNPQFQWTFTGVVFEPGCRVLSGARSAEGLTFTGCGWWDNNIANSSWMQVKGGGLSISGGYWEPLRNDETLVKIYGPFDGVSITGIRGNGLGSATNPPLLSLYDGSSKITNLNYAGNSLENCTDGIAAIQALNAGGAINTPARATRELRDRGVVGATQAIPLAHSIALTLSGGCTLSLPSGLPAGAEHRVRLFVKQDAAGSGTVTWPVNVLWPGGTAPTLTASANKTDVVELSTVTGGTQWLGSVVAQDFNT